MSALSVQTEVICFQAAGKLLVPRAALGEGGKGREQQSEGFIQWLSPLPHHWDARDLSYLVLVCPSPKSFTSSFPVSEDRWEEVPWAGVAGKSLGSCET